MKKILLILLLAISLISCGTKEEKKEIVKIGCVGEFDVSIWESLIGKLQNENINIELVPFSDYSNLNKALNGGFIDLNHFQHYAYFVNETNKNDYYLAIVEKTIIADMNMYSRNLTNISQIGINSKIAMPMDSVNLSRALKILESIGFIKLNKIENTNYNYKISDIIENYLQLNFQPMKASHIYSVMSHVDAALINFNLNSDFKSENLLYKDNYKKYSSDMYVNLIVSRLGEENNNSYKIIADLYKNRIAELIELGKIEGLTVVY